MGDLATLKKSPRSTHPVLQPENFGDLIHMDNVFGTDISIGNVHYGFLFTDWYSHITCIHPLQKSDIGYSETNRCIFCSSWFLIKTFDF